ncbi:MAG: acetylglutamate kinase [Bacteroidota bacterium]|nr:acetylglutamate kinase [Bacteroidota bacterium]
MNPNSQEPHVSAQVIARETLYVVKIGGNVIDDAPQLETFLEAFARINGKKILVHGGGKIATSIGDKLGITSQYVDGRRITDEATIDLVTMVYGGLVNKKIVAGLQAHHCNAIGISGADANLIPAVKRPVKTIDYGWVGDIKEDLLRPGIWEWFLVHQMVPVVAPLTHDKMGHILNTNADTIASALATSLSTAYQVKLVFCFEKEGVLADMEDANSVITELDHRRYETMKEGGQLFAGILPKIDNSFDAIRKGVYRVIIGNSSKLGQLIEGKGGTTIL